MHHLPRLCGSNKSLPSSLNPSHPKTTSRAFVPRRRTTSAVAPMTYAQHTRPYERIPERQSSSGGGLPADVNPPTASTSTSTCLMHADRSDGMPTTKAHGLPHLWPSHRQNRPDFGHGRQRTQIPSPAAQTRGAPRSAARLGGRCEVGHGGTHGAGLYFARSELGLRVDVVPDPVGAGESEKSPRARRIEVLHDQLACCLIGFWPRCPFQEARCAFPGGGRREEPTPQSSGPNSPWVRNTSPGKARRGLD